MHTRPPCAPRSHSCSEAIQASCLGVIREGKYRTGDLGGKASTSDFTRAIIDNLKL